MMATSRHLVRPSTADALTAYLVALRHTQVPTPEEERFLAHRIQAGEEAAVHALVECHLRFVVHVAKRYTGYYGLPLADLINEDNLGLLHAARKFDPERGVRFLTYAVWWIRQAILQALAEGSGAVRLPREQAKALVKLRQQVEVMRQQAGRDPAPDEVATALEMPAEEVQDLWRVMRPSLSLDAPLTDDSEATPLDVMRAGSVPSSEDTFFQAARVREVHRLLEHLAPREARILRARVGMDGPEQNLEAIGHELGLSADRVRQLETRAYKKLRRLARQTALTHARN
jgi:RNA polymerase primary sigma factor